MPKSHEKAEKVALPSAPPPPASARIRKPAIATKNMAATPLKASELMLLSRASSDFFSREFFFCLPFFIERMIPRHEAVMTIFWLKEAEKHQKEARSAIKISMTDIKRTGLVNCKKKLSVIGLIK